MSLAFTRKLNYRAIYFHHLSSPFAQHDNDDKDKAGMEFSYLKIHFTMKICERAKPKARSLESHFSF